MQEGVVGLLRALERYEPTLGVPFWGYATWWVRHAMQQLIAELLALERIPHSMDEPIRGQEGELGVFGELLADPLAEDAYQQLLDNSEIEQVRALLSSLNERERRILRALRPRRRRAVTARDRRADRSVR